jgi:hypothetical protein
MQNFGRGMWRRIGDYERLQTPQLLQQYRLQQYLSYIDYQKQLDREKAIKEHRDQTLKNINKQHIVEEIKEDTIPYSDFNPSIEIIAVETEIPHIEVEVSETINVENSVETDIEQPVETINVENSVETDIEQPVETYIEEKIVSLPSNIIPKKTRKKKTK